MSWYTDGKATRNRDGKVVKIAPSTHRKTGATNMREHREHKTHQAETRNIHTRPERTRMYRLRAPEAFVLSDGSTTESLTTVQARKPKRRRSR